MMGLQICQSTMTIHLSLVEQIRIREHFSNPDLAFGRLHALYIPFVDSLANHFQIPDLIVGHIDQGVFVVGQQAKMNLMYQTCFVEIDQVKNNWILPVDYQNCS